MRNKLVLLLSSLTVAFSVSAKTIVVTTTNNVSPPAGETNLIQAIQLLADGDTIAFNIPGPGPHYLVTPPQIPGGGGGYPEITHNNVTIDGYTQPGAAPNSNTILATNNAQIKIVLDSREGGSHVWNIPGYGDTESGILVVSGNNLTIRGLSLLGMPNESVALYGVSLGKGADNAHINGCWFGVDPDGVTVAGFNDGITGFRHDGDTQTGVVVGVRPDSTNPRAEFNVFGPFEIPIIIEGNNIRISGNFIGMLPDGKTRIPNPFGWEGHIEIGREGWDTVIGTDGDGVNDAEERNVLSGGINSATGITSEGTYNTIIEFYSGNSRTNIVIAGNYIGVDVNGNYLTNGNRILNGLNNMGQVRMGSDFDGVSDEIEANVIANYHPFEAMFPVPAGLSLPEFMGIDVNAGVSAEMVSLRGNSLINNNIAPISYANGLFTSMEKLTNYYAIFTVPEIIVPQISTNSTQSRISGRVDLGLDPYTNIMIDVYVADMEGWTNGQAFFLGELTWYDEEFAPQYYGFAQGRTFLGTFVENGPEDLNPEPGSFEFNVGSWGLAAGTPITATANYSALPPRTRNAPVQTSLFAYPVNLLPGLEPQVTIGRGGDNSVTISWPAAAGSFTVQSASALQSAAWSNIEPQPPTTQVGDNMQATISIGTGNQYFRLAR